LSASKNVCELLVAGDDLNAHLVLREWEVAHKLRKQLFNGTRRSLSVGPDIEQIYCLAHAKGWPANVPPKQYLATAPGKAGLWSLSGPSLIPWSIYHETNGVQLIGPNWNKRTHILDNYVITYDRSASERIVLDSVKNGDEGNTVTRAIVFMDSAGTAGALVDALRRGEAMFITLNKMVKAMVVVSEGNPVESQSHRVFIYGIDHLTGNQRQLLRSLRLSIDMDGMVRAACGEEEMQRVMEQLEVAS
jgi:hypothetical protein